ncbi:MAG: hypothetical protein ACRCXK_10075 [Wohlfahrtiimonas sp.]
MSKIQNLGFLLVGYGFASLILTLTSEYSFFIVVGAILVVVSSAVENK